MLNGHIAEFLTALRQRGRALSTVEQYRWHLDKLIAWLNQNGVTHTDQINRHTLRTWGAELTGKWAPATTRQAISAARAFFSWSLDEGLIDTNPALALQLPHVPRRHQRTLTIAEVRTLLAACDGSLTGLRNRALIAVLLDTGLRSAEICRLTVAGLDLERGQLTVKIKGGAEGLAFYGGLTADHLRAWLDIRPAQPEVHTVFVSIGGRKPGHSLTTAGLRAILRNLGNRANVPGVSPHAFRRSFATVLTQAGVPSRAVQLLGRWSNIEMVERYTAALQIQQIGNSYSAMNYVENGSAEP